MVSPRNPLGCQSTFQEPAGYNAGLVMEPRLMLYVHIGESVLEVANCAGSVLLDRAGMTR